MTAGESLLGRKGSVVLYLKRSYSTGEERKGAGQVGTKKLDEGLVMAWKRVAD